MKRFPKPKPTAFTTTDTLFIFVITIFSFAIHLWVINNPNAVVFDEVHFGNFTNWYTLSEYYNDIHPPLGKMIMFWFANLSEYDASIDFASNYGRGYNSPSYIVLRLTPAVFSALCAPLIYLTIRFESFQSCAAFTGAFISLCDTSMLTEQRHILSDGMLHFFTCLFLAINAYTSNLKQYTLKWKLWMFISGISLGCACSCKDTAWGMMPFAAFIQVFQTLQFVHDINLLLITETIYRGLFLLIPTISVYLLTFAVHLIILPFHGQGTPYLWVPLKAHLINKEVASCALWGNRLKPPNLLVRIAKINIDMNKGNMGIRQFHYYQSRPINWPLLTGNYVAFWGGGRRQVVNCMGNAFVYYIAFFSICLNTIKICTDRWEIAIRYVLGWAFSYLPFFLVPRSMYLYHYLIPLILGCISSGMMIQLYFPPYWRGSVAVILCSFSFLGFILWSAYSYGTPHYSEKYTIWTDRWRYGDKFHREVAPKLYK